MKGLIITLIAVLILAFMPALVWPQADETGGGPPVAQPMVREGALAVKLAAALNLGATSNEAEAEGLLAAAGIAPRNGWIADYPVTPDIVGELRSAVGDASDARRLTAGKDVSLKAFDGVMAGQQLSISPDATGRAADDPREAVEQDPAVVNDYYDGEGPPVVTYYAPPPDYAYLYTWVPYPFWWTSYWFPGFFMLVDFDRVVYVDHYRHHFSNHVFDRRGGRFYSVDPATRAHGGRFFGNSRPRGYRAAHFGGANTVSGRAMNGAITRGGRTFTPSLQGGRNGARPAARTFISPPARSSSGMTAPARSYQAVPQQRALVNSPAVTPRASVPAIRNFDSGGGARSFAPSMGGSTGRSFSAGTAGGVRSFGGGWRR